MKLSIHLTIALVLLPLSVNAQGIKRDILGISLGTPLPEVASRKIIASAGDWTPPQEQLVPVGDYKCKKLGVPWRLSSGELSCKIDKLSHLSLEVALLADPPTIQSITYNFCSTDEAPQVLERVYKDYGITSGLKEMNFTVWGPDYKLDSRTTLKIGYSGQSCSEGKAYELKLQDFQIRTVNTKNQQELIAKRQERSITKRPERKITKRQKRSHWAATRKR
ncbi:MAG TPA: hypothetical protein VM715_10115 [Candidatus Acidoferrum sp.]|nr:hypothetical protein [Candidatus Acidoferrum sp.]